MDNNLPGQEQKFRQTS